MKDRWERGSPSESHEGEPSRGNQDGLVIYSQAARSTLLAVMIVSAKTLREISADGELSVGTNTRPILAPLDVGIVLFGRGELIAKLTLSPTLMVLS